MDLSILVISFNTRDLTLACLRSLYATPSQTEFEVILWDNASHDGTADAIEKEFPQVRVVRCPDNLGFAVANNRAAELATGRRILLLNSDTEVYEGTIDRLIAFADAHPQTVVGGRTFFADGTLNPTSVYGKPTLRSLACKGLGLSVVGRRSRWLNPESMGNWARDTARPVDIVTGCFLLMNRDDWEVLSGFDERFFMYGEDWDLCMRAADLGRPGWLCPDATLIHHGGKSDAVRSDKMVKLFEANARLFAKHWPKPKVWLAVRLLDLWALTRVLGYVALTPIQPRRKVGRATWAEIWRRRQVWRDAGRAGRAFGGETPGTLPPATAVSSSAPPVSEAPA